MKKILVSILSLILLVNISKAQDEDSVIRIIDSVANAVKYEIQSQKIDISEPYRIKPGLDIPVSLGLAGYSIYGMITIYNRDRTPESEVLALDVNNLNSLDRKTAGNDNEKAKDASDLFFYGSMPLPIVLMFDKEIRRDGLKIALLYLQAMGATGTLYTSSAMIADRFRPYSYNPNVEMARKTRGGARNSFFAGHPALVATAGFFTAKVFSDYHPEFKGKWALYTIAGGAALATGLLRIKAGEHFPTDVMVGIPVGTLSGILIPHIHKVRNGKSVRLQITPNYENGQTGFSAFYKLVKD